MPIDLEAPTPLLRLGKVLAKLDSLRASGTTDDRALAVWGAIDRSKNRPAVAALTSGAALAGAGWARARRISLRAVIHGPLTHEAAETLKLWRAEIELASTRHEAYAIQKRQVKAGAQPLPPLDDRSAMLAARASLGVELRKQLEASGIDPVALVGPAGCIASMLGAFEELRARWPELRCILLCGESATEWLPELPAREEAKSALSSALGAALSTPGGPARGDSTLASRVELVPIARAFAAQARAQLAREHGLSASHAAAASVMHARSLGLPAIALVSSTGEREFSLDPIAPVLSGASP